MSSAIKRAGLASLNNDTGEGKGERKRAVPAAASRDRVRDIGTRNFTSHALDSDESSEEDQEEYSIDPSVHLWKSIDFGTKRNTGHGHSGHHHSNSGNSGHNTHDNDADKDRAIKLHQKRMKEKAEKLERNDRNDENERSDEKRKITKATDTSIEFNDMDEVNSFRAVSDKSRSFHRSRSSTPIGEHNYRLNLTALCSDNNVIIT